MIFDFYWSWYEDYQPHLLEGEDKTREEFEADCIRALTETFDNYILNVGDTWAGLPDWIDMAAVKMIDYGYKTVKPMCFGKFGLYLPRTEMEIDEEENDLAEFSEQIKAMKKHNDALDEELYSEKDEKDAH